jgi:hypothetical protein
MNSSETLVYLPVVSFLKNCFLKKDFGPAFLDQMLKDNYLECGYDQLNVFSLEDSMIELEGRDMILDKPVKLKLASGTDDSIRLLA